VKTAATQWEYKEVTGVTINTAAWLLELNGMGSLGWEVAGIAAVDPTLGINSYIAILKRQLIGWPTPADPSPAWQHDPTGRFDRRYWDGLRWSQHVSDASGTTDTDYPNRRNP
jgi:hypothetical protein